MPLYPIRLQEAAMTESTDVAVREDDNGDVKDVVVQRKPPPAERTVKELTDRRRLVHSAMDAEMKEDIHYGKIPGIDKPTLLKPGAEMLCSLFLLDPEYENERSFDGDHLTVVSRCTLYHIPTGDRIASGSGMCSSKERKYAYRNAGRVCPKCGADQVRYSSRGAAEWYCWRKKGGCGARWPAASEEGRMFAEQDTLTANPDLPDTWNTVLKMADKRALIAAVLNGTGASDIFTQDVEEQGQAPGYAEEAAPVGPKPPQSWGEVALRLAAAGAGGRTGGEEGAQVWVEQALKAAWPPDGPAPGEQRTEARAKMAQVVVDLEESAALDPDIPLRERIQQAVARAFDGLAVAGPPWKISDNEEGSLPHYSAWLKAEGREVPEGAIEF
jgi:hypothetical protein